ncbi:DUF2946 family protein [Saccharibacter floricola]|uniref:DUF2946 family protein n=1 Tax=Saccharibacter floricola TaxID=231053 RepID=UPI0003734DC4|nr:DUF2946 family protein [Saccharibacter floricola]
MALIERLFLPPHSKRRWGLVSFLLIALVGQLGLQSFAYSGESPRATLYRLTSIDIAPQSAPIEAPHCAEGHHHHPVSHHQHDGDCPLCPLLGHILFALNALAFFLGTGALMQALWRCTPPSQAPPRLTRDRPPSRAPPLPA